MVAGVILNMTNKGRHELNQREIEEIISYPILANIRLDKKIRKSLHRQMPLPYIYPRSRSAREFIKVANHLSFDHVDI